MTKTVLIDAGPIIALFNKTDDWHNRIVQLYETFTGQFITTCPVITEALWQISSSGGDVEVQNELYQDLEKGVYRLENLTREDFARIAELNKKYEDYEPDFADLSLIVVSERLNIGEIDCR